MRRRACGICLALLMLFGTRNAVAQSTEMELRAFDQNHDDRLDHAELVAYALRDKPSPTPTDREAAGDFADDVLTAICSNPCPSIRIQDAVSIVLGIAVHTAEAEAAKRHFGWRGLGFSREVVDAANPRPAPLQAPFIVSFRRDNQASENKDQFNILGAVQLLSYGTEFAPGWIFQTTPGIDFDIDGSAGPEKSAITAGVPLYLTWVIGGNTLESLTFAFTPKFQTDRRFRREVYEGSIVVSPTSARIAAGFVRPKQIRRNGKLPFLGFYWEPSGFLETGRVVDAAGDSALAAIKAEGTYYRAGPKASVVVFPNLISEHLRLSATGTRRFDLRQGWARNYLEARADYDLVFDGTAQLSAVYRNGRKPSDFKQKDEFLIGIGIRF